MIRNWNTNAAIWDEAMAEGSDFQKTLVEPHTLNFLGNLEGKKVLDLACGNGQMSRLMTRLGASVTAIDGSQEMVNLAQQRSKDMSIAYHVADITKDQAVSFLEASEFDVVLCNMALMDIAELNPVFYLAYKALKKTGIFVFSITHPCFDKSVGSHLTEIYEVDGIRVSEHSVKVCKYLTPNTMKVRALPTFPSTHSFFHRSLQSYLSAAFEEGFLMCDMVETAFPQATELTTPSGWQKLPEIPAVFIAKFKK